MCICMRANVTMPDMSISADVLEFEEVKCGECKVITIQLHNHMEVRCDWTATAVPAKERQKVNFFISAYPCPDVAALMDLLYVSRFIAVRPTLQTLAQSSTSFSQGFFGLPLFLWPFTFPSTINF